MGDERDDWRRREGIKQQRPKYDEMAKKWWKEARGADRSLPDCTPDATAVDCDGKFHRRVMGPVIPMGDEDNRDHPPQVVTRPLGWQLKGGAGIATEFVWPNASDPAYARPTPMRWLEFGEMEGINVMRGELGQRRIYAGDIDTYVKDRDGATVPLTPDHRRLTMARRAVEQDTQLRERREEFKKKLECKKSNEGTECVRLVIEVDPSRPLTPWGSHFATHEWKDDLWKRMRSPWWCASSCGYGAPLSRPIAASIPQGPGQGGQGPMVHLAMAVEWARGTGSMMA